MRADVVGQDGFIAVRALRRGDRIQRKMRGAAAFM